MREPGTSNAQGGLSHAVIEERRFVERYVTGRLSAEETVLHLYEQLTTATRRTAPPSLRAT